MLPDAFPQAARTKPAAAMVIGGGIGGMRAALDLADAGLKVYLVEQTPCLGGRVAQLGFMFPQHDCVLCRGTADHGYGCTRPSISPAYITHNQHPNIESLTGTQVMDVAGQAGDFTVSLRQEPRYLDPDRCINCGLCAQVCPVEMPDEYQRGLKMRKAAYKISARAAPDAYVIDRGAYCDHCQKCAAVCPTQAIDLDEPPRLVSVEVGAIILALGFQIADAGRFEEFGYRRYSNVLQAIEYERLASRSGPTEGIVARPSDGQRPRSIAWLQCIGSRDQQNPYCSSICCMYATKEAILARQRLGEGVGCSVFFMDERAFNKEYTAYFTRAREEHGIRYLRCRVSEIREDPATRDLILRYASPDGHLEEERFELVVLANGLEPPASAQVMARMLGIELNEYGFCQTDKFTPLQTARPGVFVCGAFSSPKEIAETVLDASGAAAEVMRLLNDRLNAHPYTREWPFISSGELPPERDTAGEPPRLGLFLCKCGGTISDSLDLGQLAHQASGWPGVADVEVLDTACFPETLQHIQRRILDGGLNRAVIAACSNRTHEPLFQRAIRQVGLNPYLLELVNIREQCSRVHQAQRTQANKKAQELVRVAAGRALAARPVHRDKHRCRPSALVIGGGVAGMTAALAIGDSGFDVHLVERSEALGGNLHNLHYVAEGYNPQRLLRDLVNRVRSHQRIQVHTRSELVRQAGHIGYFQSELETRRPDGRADRLQVEHGVTIVATGGREGRDHPWLSLPHVTTQAELEAMMIHHPEQIAALKDVVMIQCVRMEGVEEYCSRVCCTNTMKNAIRLRLLNPTCRVSVLYKNIVTYGFREEFYTEARRLGVVFVRYTSEHPPEITVSDQRSAASDQLSAFSGRGTRAMRGATSDQRLANDFSSVVGRPRLTASGQLSSSIVVKAWDPALNRPLSLPADLVTLSMPVVPSDGTLDLANKLRLPLSSEGFYAEAQIKLRPMDFVREGIFLAGIAHYPKFLEESISHALAAAGRAITLLSQETLYLGGVVAQVDPEKCAGCLTCTRTCPFGIPQIVQLEGRAGVGGLGGAAYIDPAQCQGCGTCTGECPAEAIQLVNYTDDQIMLRSIGGLGQWLPVNSEQ